MSIDRENIATMIDELVFHDPDSNDSDLQGLFVCRKIDDPKILSAISEGYPFPDREVVQLLSTEGEPLFVALVRV
jgi:hypothetical protein